MMIETMSEVVNVLAATGSISADGVADVCAQPPTGVKQYVDQLLGWVKYGVMALIIGGGFAATGALVVGKMAQMSKAAQIGASGLLWTILAAIAYVTIYAILNGIVGNGC